MPTAPFVLSDAELVEAYAATAWSIEGPAGTLRVRLDGSVPDASLRPGGIVTAFNPASIARDADENRAADQELLKHVRSLGVPFRRSHARGGGDGSWDEPGFLLTGDVRPLLVELGLVFGQNAVVWIDAAGQVSLVCTRAGFAGRLPGQKIDLLDG